MPMCSSAGRSGGDVGCRAVPDDARILEMWASYPSSLRGWIMKVEVEAWRVPRISLTDDQRKALARRADARLAAAKQREVAKRKD